MLIDGGIILDPQSEVGCAETSQSPRACPSVTARPAAVSEYPRQQPAHGQSCPRPSLARVKATTHRVHGYQTSRKPACRAAAGLGRVVRRAGSAVSGCQGLDEGSPRPHAASQGFSGSDTAPRERGCPLPSRPRVVVDPSPEMGDCGALAQEAPRIRLRLHGRGLRARPGRGGALTLVLRTTWLRFGASRGSSVDVVTLEARRRTASQASLSAGHRPLRRIRRRCCRSRPWSCGLRVDDPGRDAPPLHP